MAKPELDFLAGGGEMGALMRAMDWSKTPLGAPAAWPQSLRSAISILLPSKAQIALFWGPELITLYNDAYRPVFGGKHPHALGRPIREAWSELWRAGLKELFENVLSTGEAFWAKDRPFYMERHGFPEETFFDVSYDPVRDESGRVGGVFCIVNETTARVVGERRLKVLRDLGAVAAQAHSVAEAWTLSARALAAAAFDVPFADIDLEDCAEWPLGVHETAALERHMAIAPGPWPEPARSVMVLPLAERAGERGGKIALGVSSRLALDDDYRAFFQLAAGQVAASLAAARAAEAERRRAEALAELDRAKTAFFSNVSHEFRTPLTLMLGPIADALADAEQPLPPAQRERQELVLRNALRLQKLVNTLLDFSRVEAGRAQASYAPTDLAGFTANVAASFRSAIEKAGLSLVVDCPPLPERAYIDREMWEKIVLNLLSNAFKFTFEGAIRVSLRMDENFVLEVQDTGIGIAAAALPRIFERFHRVEGAKSRTHEGTGIGLALVKELVRLHGGVVTAQSVEGRGSTFTISMPRGRAHLPPERIGAPAELASTALGPGAYVQEALGWLATPASAEAAPAGARPRIVWADDNADMRAYVERLLAPRYEVEAVGDGEAALAAVRRSRPDLLLADVMMPRLDGLGLARAVRSDEALRDLPVLLLSARAGEDARIEGLDAGADAYVQKPFNARELLARVEALVQLAQARRRAFGEVRDKLEELETLLQALPVGVFIARDAACAKIDMNPAGAAILRMPECGNASKTGPAREQLPFRVLKDAVEVAGEDLPMQRAARLGRPVIGEEIVVSFADGTSKTLYEHAVPLFGPDGKTRGCVGVFVDITDRKLAEEALREADRRKDEFIATLSHELRNPLAPLANALEILRLTRGADEPPVLAMMERQVRQLVRLTDDLLEMSRITRGSFELRRERTPLGGIVRNALETAEPLIRAARHSLTVASSPEELWVDGDPVRLAQIIANLVSNAAKYTDEGGSIAVEVRRERAHALVAVRDNGAGLAPHELARVFDMFARGERSTGLGIGLALARRLAEMHGGTIEAASAGPGQGADFTLRLPLASAPVTQPEGAQAAWRAMTQKRVLVVDDNRDAADSLGTLLEHLGAEVRVVHDARQALAAFEAYRPGVVLLDLGMPELDGYEVARAIRARERDSRVPLVALTGWGQEQDRRRVHEAGFDHHLVKPADIGALRALLGSL